MTVKLLTKHHLEFLSLKVDCTGTSESTLVKIPHCWKSHVVAQISLIFHVIHLLAHNSHEMMCHIFLKNSKRMKKLSSAGVIYDEVV